MNSALLIDAGNTRMKYRFSQEFGVFESLSDIERFVQSRLPGKVCLADVAGRANSIRDLVKEFGVEFVPCRVQDGLLGLDLAYEDVSKLGVDRWLSMLGGMAHCPDQNLVVVDVGTAVKIDVIESRPEGVVHLGGSISPGLKMAAQSLHVHTDRLPLVQIESRPDLGCDTSGCISFGVVQSVIALIERTVIKFARNSQILLTGGDCEIIVPHLDIDFEVKPNLVLDGMASFVGMNVESYGNDS